MHVRSLAVVAAIVLIAGIVPVSGAEETNAERNVAWILERGSLEEVPPGQATVHTDEGIEVVDSQRAFERFGEMTSRVDLRSLMQGATNGPGLQTGDVWLTEVAVEFSDPQATCPSVTTIGDGSPEERHVDPQFWLYNGTVHDIAQSNVAVHGFGSHVGWTTKDVGGHRGMASMWGPHSDWYCIENDLGFLKVTLNVVMTNGFAVQYPPGDALMP